MNDPVVTETVRTGQPNPAIVPAKAEPKAPVKPAEDKPATPPWEALR